MLQQLDANHRILTIIPAPPGWMALFEVSDDDDLDHIEVIESAIMCWALVETTQEDGRLRQDLCGIAPMDHFETCLIENTPEFMGYRTPHEPPTAEELRRTAQIV